MYNITPKIILNNNVEIPCIGNGPGIMKVPSLWKANNNFVMDFMGKVVRKTYYLPRFTKSISHAMSIGFTLLDYSTSYGYEKYIGKAIKKSGVGRHNIFLTSRVSNSQQIKGNIKEQLLNTLKYYNTDYVDLYMFHWPVSEVYLDTWQQMIELYKQGYCRSIGVANCHQHHLEEILKISDVVPAVNQVEVHPLFTQKPLVEYCKSKNIVVEAYTPVSRFDDRLVRLPLLKNIAEKYNKNIVQIILRWHIQNGVIPVVRSMNKKHQCENISIFDFELTSEEMKAIDRININSRLRYDPDNCDFSIL